MLNFMIPYGLLGIPFVPLFLASTTLKYLALETHHMTFVANPATQICIQGDRF